MNKNKYEHRLKCIGEETLSNYCSMCFHYKEVKIL